MAWNICRTQFDQPKAGKLSSSGPEEMGASATAIP